MLDRWQIGAVLQSAAHRHRLDEGTHVPLQEVRRQLDILEEQGFIKSANTFGGHSTYLAPKGMDRVDELREMFEDQDDDPARPIGFE